MMPDIAYPSSFGQAFNELALYCKRSGYFNNDCNCSIHTIQFGSESTFWIDPMQTLAEMELPDSVIFPLPLQQRPSCFHLFEHNLTQLWPFDTFPVPKLLTVLTLAHLHWRLCVFKYEWSMKASYSLACSATLRWKWTIIMWLFPLQYRRWLNQIYCRGSCPL